MCKNKNSPSERLYKVSSKWPGQALARIFDDIKTCLFYQHSISKLQILSMQICRLQYLVPSRRVQNQRDGVHFDFNLLVISHSKLSLLTFPPSARSCSKICIKYSKHGSSTFSSISLIADIWPILNFEKNKVTIAEVFYYVNYVNFGKKFNC